MMSQKKIDSEKVIERKLVEQTKLNGGLCIKLLCNHMIGLPDRLCLFKDGRLAFVELKTTGEKPRRIQEIVHNKLRALGFRVYVIDTLEGVSEFIDEITNLPF